jgi:alpha-L-arabinofuranosidase
VRVEADGNALPTEAGRGGRGGPQAPTPPPGLSVSASRRGSQVVVTFINPRHDDDMQVECAIRGASVEKARAQILHDADLNASNGFDHPDRITVRPHEAVVENGAVRLNLPAMSVATVTVS